MTSSFNNDGPREFLLGHIPIRFAFAKWQAHARENSLLRAQEFQLGRIRIAFANWRAVAKTYSLLRAQEFQVGRLSIRSALAKWQAEARRQAEADIKFRTASTTRDVGSLYRSMMLWRLRHQHCMWLVMLRDPRWAFEHFWRTDVADKIQAWKINVTRFNIPVKKLDGWPAKVKVAKITRVDRVPRAQGQKGRMSIVITFISTDGETFEMPLKYFKENSPAMDLYSAFRKEKAPAMPSSRHQEEAFGSLKNSKSMARFRSRASSTVSTVSKSDIQSSESEDSDSEYNEDDRMAELIKDRMGSESVARKFRSKSRHEGLSVKSAVDELQQSLRVLKRSEQMAAEKSKLDRDQRQEEEFELARARAEFAKIQEAAEADQVLEKKMKEAGVNNDLFDMVNQSAKQTQESMQAKLMDQRLAASEQKVKEMEELITDLAKSNSSVVHVRQYSSRAEMLLEKELDKCTFVHAEDHRQSSDVQHRTCLVEGCPAEVIKGKKFCLLGHPTSIRQLRCPWPGCGAPCCGTVQQMLRQPICFQCERPLIHSNLDDRAKLQLMKDVQEASREEEGYVQAPKGKLANVLPKNWQITEGENKWWQLLRSANDPDNYVVCKDAYLAYDAVNEMIERSSTVPMTKILGSAADFKISVRALVAMFGGAKSGRGFAFQIYELAQVAGVAQERQFLKWTKEAFKDGQFSEPDWDDPQAICWLQHYFDALTFLLRHVAGSQVADDHAAAIVVFMTALKKEGPKRVRFSPRMLWHKHSAWFAQFHTMGVSFVEESAYFDTLYGDFVLWNNPGTHEQAPKLVARWFEKGISVWHPIFEKCFDEPARQQLWQAAHQAVEANDPSWKTLAGNEIHLSSDIYGKFGSDFMKRNISHRHMHSHRSFLWPNTKGDWVKIVPDFCLACLKSNCTEIKCKSFHSDCYFSTKEPQMPALNFMAFSIAIRETDKPSDITAEKYRDCLARVRKKHPKQFRRPEFDLTGSQAEGTETDEESNHPASPTTAFQAWISGDAIPRHDLVQPSLLNTEARWHFEEPKVGSTVSGVAKEMAVSLIVPSISGGRDHTFKAKALDVGEHIRLQKGGVESRKCVLKALAFTKGADAASLLASAREDAKKFIPEAIKMGDGFGHLNHLQFLRDIECYHKDYANMLARHQGITLAWLKAGWLKELGSGPIAYWSEEAGKVQLKLLLLCVNEVHHSRVTSTVAHILGSEGHAWVLEWEAGLSSMAEVLAIADPLHRYADVSIVPCTFMENTLEGQMPFLPGCLAAKKSLESMVQTSEGGFAKLAGNELECQQRIEEGENVVELVMPHCHVPVVFGPSSWAHHNVDVVADVMTDAWLSSVQDPAARHCRNRLLSMAMDDTYYSDSADLEVAEVIKEYIMVCKCAHLQEAFLAQLNRVVLLYSTSRHVRQLVAETCSASLKGSIKWMVAVSRRRWAVPIRSPSCSCISTNIMTLQRTVNTVWSDITWHDGDSAMKNMAYGQHVVLLDTPARWVRLSGRDDQVDEAWQALSVRFQQHCFSASAFWFVRAASCELAIEARVRQAQESYHAFTKTSSALGRGHRRALEALFLQSESFTNWCDTADTTILMVSNTIESKESSDSAPRHTSEHDESESSSDSGFQELGRPLSITRQAELEYHAHGGFVSQSLSPPRFMQVDFAKSPLSQYKQAVSARRYVLEGDDWIGRMAAKQPNTKQPQVRHSIRHRTQTDRLVLAVSSSESMLTDLSSSLSSDEWLEDQPLASWVKARMNTRSVIQVASLPAHLRCPPSQEIRAAAARRNKQAHLAWPTEDRQELHFR